MPGPRPKVLALLLTAALLSLAPAAADARTARSFTGKVRSTVHVTFKISTVDAANIVRGELRVAGSTIRLKRPQILRAARKGVLRVRISRAMRAALRKRRGRARLVLVVDPTPSGTSGASGTSTPTPGAAAPESGRPSTSAPASTSGAGITQWRAPGSQPLTDAQAAARVRRAPELRPQNASANGYVPSEAELRTFHAARYEAGPNKGALGDDVIPHQRHVTGGFTGTTDEILQWAAHKWGIPEDILRAAATQESTWKQAAMGDKKDVPDAGAYPAQARISSTQVYQSMGLMQIKWRADGSLHPGTEPLRWKSTAFNADFYGAMLRFYYDGGARSWFSSSSSYGAGQEWESVGGWFQPTPWGNAYQMAYIERVQARLAERAWEKPGF